MGKNGTGKSADPFYYKHRNFFVGIFVLIPVLVVPALLLFALVKSEMLENWVTLNLQCETGMGLKKSTMVNILGKNVGHVHSVILNEKGYVDVVIKIKRRYHHFVHKDSKAWLKQKNFVVGDWEIDITMGDGASPQVEDGDTLAVQYQIRLEKMVEVFTEIMTPLESIFESLAKGEGILKYIFGEDTILTDIHIVLGRVNNLFTEINRTLANANQMIDNLGALGTHGIVTIDTLMVFSQRANRLVENLDYVVADVDSLIAGFDDLPGDVDSLIVMLMKDVREAEILLKAIRNHWLFRRTIKRQMRKEEREMEER